MAKVGYLGIDQYGDKYILRELESPRKQLLEKLDKKQATKMYCDTKDGQSKHVGYIVGGRWVTLYEVHSWESKGR